MTVDSSSGRMIWVRIQT
ncbi:hypothetical protein LINGRAPRIM_LOCUS2064 [Linum grandiflorum]